MRETKHHIYGIGLQSGVKVYTPKATLNKIINFCHGCLTSLVSTYKNIVSAQNDTRNAIIC